MDNIDFFWLGFGGGVCTILIFLGMNFMKPHLNQLPVLGVISTFIYALYVGFLKLIIDKNQKLQNSIATENNE